MDAAAVPAARVAVINAAPANDKGEHVLYWMIAQRREACRSSSSRRCGWATRGRARACIAS